MYTIYTSLSLEFKKYFHIFIRVLFEKYEKNPDVIETLFSFEFYDKNNLAIRINSDEDLLDDIRANNYEFIDYKKSVYSLGNRDEVVWRSIFSKVAHNRARIFLKIGFN